MIRVMLPAHLRTLARVGEEVQVRMDGPATAAARCWTRSRPAIRSSGERSAATAGGRRRPFIRFFACEQDLSHEPPDAPLPDAVASGAEPFLVVGAMAGG